MLWVLVKKQVAEVFKGYFYDGGNTVKGLFKGEPIEMGGSGD